MFSNIKYFEGIFTHCFLFCAVLLIAFSGKAAAAGSCSFPANDIPIGIELVAECTGASSYKYVQTDIKCLNGQVVKGVDQRWFSGGQSYTPDDAQTAFVDTAVFSSGKIFGNSEKTHFVIVNNTFAKYNGVLDGISLKSLAYAPTIYIDKLTDVFVIPDSGEFDLDEDNDGYFVCVDCNDQNPAVHDVCCEISADLSATSSEIIASAGGSTTITGSISSSQSFSWIFNIPNVVSMSESSVSFSYAWDGLDENGNVMPPGIYYATLTAVTDDGKCSDAKSIPIIVRRPKGCLLNIPSDSSLNVASGTVTDSLPLFSASGGPMPLSVSLSFNSRTSFIGGMGARWSHNYEMALHEDSNGHITVSKGGSGRSYLLDGNNYFAQTGDYSTLVKNGDGTFTLSERDGRKYYFDSSGRIVAMEDADGNQTTFNYSIVNELTVTDPLQRTAVFHYNPAGQIDFITGPAGVESTYDITYYQGTNLLWKVEAPAPVDGAERPTWVYTYVGNDLQSKTDPELHTVFYNYVSHKVESSTVDGGVPRSVSYDPTTRTTTVTERDGGVWTYRYDAISGTLTSKADPVGNLTSYLYYADGSVLGRTEPGNSVSPGARTTVFYTYDSYGNKLTETVPIDIQASYGIDPDSLTPSSFATLTPAPSVATSYTYDYANDDHLLSVTDERGVTPLTTQYVYTTEEDSADPEITYDVTTIIDPEGNARKTRRYTDGRIKDVVDGNNQSTLYDYYVAGQLKSITQPTGVVTEFLNYDQLGNPWQIKISEPGGEQRVIDQVFDRLGRLIKYTQTGTAGTFVTEYGYDKKGNRNFVLDAEHAGDPSKATTYLFNYYGQPIFITDGLGNITELEYGTSGCGSCGGGGQERLTGVIDAKHVADPEPRPKTSYKYDQNGLLSRETDQLGKTLLYQYYPSGKLYRTYFDTNANLTIDDGTDQLLLSYTYNLEGRLLDKTDHLSGEVTSFGYDDNGRLETAANSTISYTMTYYDNGWLHTVTDSNGRVIRYDAYDGNGQRDLVTLFPDTADERILDYGFDTFGRLQTIKTELDSQLSGNDQFVIGYDGWGRRETLSYPNGVFATYSYDDVNKMDWLAGIAYTDGPGGTSILNIGYPLHDKVGNRKQRREDSIVTDYQYDDIYQVTQAKTGPSEENFVWDEVGNRRGGPTVKEVLDSTYVHNAANQMEQGRKYSYAYDDFGNQTYRYLNAAHTKYWQYIWSVENQLKQAWLVKDGVTLRTVSFEYDPFGRRIAKQVTDALGTTTITYVYDGEDFVMQLVDDGSTTTTTQYVHGPGIDEPLAMVTGGQSYYYHADGLGSVVALTDSAKNVVQRFQYDTFGVIVSVQDAEFGNTYIYTAREWDRELGLYYYRARYYDPMDGRFISRDPISFRGGDVNLYGYVVNNPIVLTDPHGTAYPGTPTPNAGDFVEVINTFLSFYNAINLSNQAMTQLNRFRYDVPCGEKKLATVCFNHGPPPSNLSVFMGRHQLTAPGTSCVSFTIEGAKGCPCLDEILQRLRGPEFKAR